MKIGIFLNGELMIEYPFDGDKEVYTEALEDLTKCIEETGQFHELKLFLDEMLDENDIETAEAEQTITTIATERDKLRIAIGAALTSISYTEINEVINRVEVILQQALKQ